MIKDKRIVIIGDSLSEYRYSPGYQLTQLFLDAGADVTLDAKSGRSTMSYFNFERGKQRLARYRDNNPDLVVIFLGTNSINAEAQWQELATWPSGTKVVCLSPPPLVGKYAARVRRDHVVSRQKKYFNCWVDLEPLCLGVERSADTVHFTAKGAAVLARRLYDLLSDRKLVKTPKSNLGLAATIPFSGLLWIIERRDRLRGQD